MTEQNKEEIIENKEDSFNENENKEIALSGEEQLAHGYGWKVKEEWVNEGNKEEDWVPAKHFLKFGELKQQVISKDKQLSKAEKLVKMMKDHHLKVRQTAYEDAVKTLRVERTKALEDGELVKAEAIKDKIEEEKERFSKQRVLPADIEEAEREPVQQAAPVNPDFPEWHSRNPWYIVENSKQDELSKEADKIAAGELLAAQNTGKNLTAKDIYDVVEKKIRKLYPEKFEKRKSPQSDSPSQSGKDESSGSSKLSAEELAVAKAFDLSPEKYIAQQKTYKGR